MISMNISPPRPSEASSVAMQPAEKARMRKRPSLNIGSVVRISMATNPASTAMPPTMPTITFGLVQPIGWPPYGWMP